MTSPETTTAPDRRWWTLGAVCVATFMLLLDITIVNVALPDIAKDLGSSFSDLQWVVDAYALSLAALLLTAGSLADLLGRRPVFVLGLAIFTTASLLCARRDVAVLPRASRGRCRASARPRCSRRRWRCSRRRSRAASAVPRSASGARRPAPPSPSVRSSAACSPSRSGGSRSSCSTSRSGSPRSPRRSGASRSRAIPDAAGVDWAGLVTFSSGLFLLVFALVRGNPEGWGSPLIVGFLVGAVVLLVAFVVVERRQSRPMFDLSLLRKPAFAGASIAAFALSASLFSLFLYMTLYIQNALGYSPLQAGLRFLPTTLVSFFVAPIAGKLSSTVPVRIMISGGLFRGVALLLDGATRRRLGLDRPAARVPVAGVGVGLINPPLASTAVGVVPPAARRDGLGDQHRPSGRSGSRRASPASARCSRRCSPTRRPARWRACPAEVLATGIPAGRGAVAGGAARLPAVFTSALNDLFVVGAVVAITGGVLSALLIRRSDFVASAGAQRGSRARARGRAGALDGDPRRRADRPRGERPLEHGLLGAARTEHVADAHAPAARLEPAHSASSGTRPWARTRVPTPVRQRVRSGRRRRGAGRSRPRAPRPRCDGRGRRRQPVEAAEVEVALVLVDALADRRARARVGHVEAGSASVSAASRPVQPPPQSATSTGPGHGRGVEDRVRARRRPRTAGGRQRRAVGARRPSPGRPRRSPPRRRPRPRCRGAPRRRPPQEPVGDPALVALPQSRGGRARGPRRGAGRRGAPQRSASTTSCPAAAGLERGRDPGRAAADDEHAPPRAVGRARPRDRPLAPGPRVHDARDRQARRGSGRCSPGCSRCTG